MDRSPPAKPRCTERHDKIRLPRLARSRASRGKTRKVSALTIAIAAARKEAGDRQRKKLVT
jgi:hypothetical protein